MKSSDSLNNWGHFLPYKQSHTLCKQPIEQILVTPPITQHQTNNHAKNLKPQQIQKQCACFHKQQAKTHHAPLILQ